jgi:exodeoxyribonuclease V alpha subunit
MSEAAHTLKCALERIRYSGRGFWSVASVRRSDTGALATACGPLTACSEGDTLELVGSWEEDPNYGAQFKFSKARTILPSDDLGVLRWLQRLPGVGRNRAIALVKRFGSADIYSVIEKSPERLAEVPGVTEAGAEDIRASYLAISGSRQVEEFLSRWGLTDWQISQVQGWAKRNRIREIESTVRDNPYRLLEVEGFGFITADGIARRMGIALDHIERAKAAALYILDAAKQEGHCYLPVADLARRAAKLDVPKKSTAKAADDLASLGKVGEMVGDDDGARLVALPELRKAELESAALLLALVAAEPRGRDAAELNAGCPF